MKTAEVLEKSWISTQVVSIPLIKPMYQKAIINYIQGKKWVFTIEEHTIIWWLGDSIASIIAENNMNIKFKKFWIQDIFPSTVWDQGYMRKLVGLDEEDLSKNILDLLS
jgi:transketolase C-terminal domain/subunit